MKSLGYDTKKYIKMYNGNIRIIDTPSTGRDGFYYDRKSEVSWMEWQGIVFTYPEIISAFESALYIDDENILPGPVLDAIRILDVYRVDVRNLDDTLYDHKQASILRNINRDARKTCMKILQNIKQEKQLKEKCDVQ